MQNRYLEDFDNIFFNIEKYNDIKNIIKQACDVFDSVITKFGEVECKMALGISRKNDFVDTVIILFIRKIMEQLDSINVLYSVGSFEPAQIILRSLIENIVALEFILKEQTPKRAAAYFLEHHYQELDKSEIYYNTKSEYAKTIIAKYGKDVFDKECKRIKEKREALERLIQSNSIFQEIDTARKKKLDSKCKQNKKKESIYSVV